MGRPLEPPPPPKPPFCEMLPPAPPASPSRRDWPPSPNPLEPPSVEYPPPPPASTEEAPPASLLAWSEDALPPLKTVHPDPKKQPCTVPPPPHLPRVGASGPWNLLNPAGRRSCRLRRPERHTRPYRTFQLRSDVVDYRVSTSKGGDCIGRSHGRHAQEN